MKKLILATLLAATFANANAACSRADLTGRWVIFTDVSSPAEGGSISRCVINFPATGNVSSSGACAPVGYSGLNTSVTMTINTSCDISGRISTSTIAPFSFLAHLEAGKTVMSGGWYRSSTIGGALSGSK